MGTKTSPLLLSVDMFETRLEPSDAEPIGIAKHEVSEDGVHWRPFDPQADRNRVLHSRIEFASED